MVQNIFNTLIIKTYVTPSGFEPKSSEPESEILSIELWGLDELCRKCINILPDIANSAVFRFYRLFTLRQDRNCKLCRMMHTQCFNQ